MPPGPSADPFAALLTDDTATAALGAARDAFDALLWRRDVRANAAAVAADSVDRGARSSAAIDGADVVVPDDSPMGRTLACALAVTLEVPRLVDIWERAPLQALAALHARAAVGFCVPEAIGRPRSDDVADDPLNIGGLPPAAAVPPRLAALARRLTAPTSAPALLVAGVVHAELMALRPFAHGSGLVARATIRLVLAGRGLDPSLFSIPEHGIVELGRPAYVRAVRGYASGEPSAVAEYLRWFATAVGTGAKAVRVPG